jgi:hypothetical protein
MRPILLFLSFLFLLGHASAQPLGDLNGYLQSDKVHEGAKQYFNEERKAAADSFTSRIADSMRTKNDFVRPFYMLLVSRMFMYADAELATMLFDDCYDVLEKRPNELVEFLYGNSRFVNSDFKVYWASAISSYLARQHPGEGKRYLHELNSRQTKECKKKNKKDYTAFMDIIEAGL